MQITGVGSRRVIQVASVLIMVVAIIGRVLHGHNCSTSVCIEEQALGHMTSSDDPAKFASYRCAAGKFGGLFASMPQAMVSGLFAVMFGIIAGGL